MLLIMTGTIRPAKQMRQLVLRNQEERLRQYEDSIRFFIESRAFSKIIFCENSNYGIASLSNLQKIAMEKDVQLELLSFQGNVEEGCIHGKGYGEGEIMNYVFSHSRLIREEDFFVKITGRLTVDNIKDIVERMEVRKTYFNIPNRTIREIYDTRMYGMPVEQFRRDFLDAYPQVMDDNGTFLETVYTNILKEKQIRVCNFPRYPRIVGMSASGGAVYGYSEWKCKVKDLLSQFHHYKVKG